MLAHVHVRIGRELLANGLNGLVHGDDATVDVFVREVCVGRGAVVADDVLADDALDAVAADDSSVGSFGAVAEEETEAFGGPEVFEVDQALAEVRDVTRDQLDKLVEQVRAVEGGLAGLAFQFRDELGVGVA